MKHYSEADLLETYYTQPGQSMPVMLHLADCRDCAARYERLERKLREAAVCHPEKPTTFWTRQRLQVMRRVEAHNAQASTTARTLRVAAAAVYESVKPVQQHPPAPAIAAAPSTTAVPPPAPADIHDAWQSDELKDFHNVVEWEAWVPEDKATPTQGSSL